MQADSQPPGRTTKTKSEDGVGLKVTSKDEPTDSKTPSPAHVDVTVSRSADLSRKGFKYVALVVIVLAYTLLRAQLWNLKSRRLSSTYAVCSREGNIYTVDSEIPKAECMVVHQGRIVDVGRLVTIRARWGDKDKTGPALGGIRLPGTRNGIEIHFVKAGHIVVPGLTDAHAHILEYGFKRQLELDDCGSLSEAVNKIKQYVLDHPDIVNDTTKWVQGMGWDQTRWPGTQFPTAADLEAEPLLRGRPMAFRRVDGHALWVSQKVIDQSGELPDEVNGGAIFRDDSGKPSGVFVDNAMALINIPSWSTHDMLKFFKTTSEEALAYGLTSIHDADTNPQFIGFYKKLAEHDALPFRIYAMGYVDSDEYWGDQIPRLINYGTSGRLNVRSIKLFSDGAIGSWGAALIEPYSDKPETSGFLRSSPESFRKLVQKFFEDGLQVNIHCIGDRANHVILDIFEEVLEGRNVTEHRPRIEHSQIITPDDLKRIARLGVIPSVQPTHATSDMHYAEQRLGPERIKGAYAYRTLLESSQKQVLPLGSDFPVEGVNPLFGFYAAVTRLDVNGNSPHGPGGWYPEQKLSRTQALKGMTLDPAYASFSEHELGSITIGKKADFVVLDRDIMTVPQTEILETKVVATVIDGQLAYGHPVYGHT